MIPGVHLFNSSSYGGICPDLSIFEMLMERYGGKYPSDYHILDSRYDVSTRTLKEQFLETGNKPVISPHPTAIDRLKVNNISLKEKIISVTLRESSYQVGRNSN